VRFPELAAELVGLNVDVILASNTQAVAAARSTTATIPIVMVGVVNSAMQQFGQLSSGKTD
jgi:putative tryptophan/tyrosine transport system substrate-binding protein